MTSAVTDPPDTSVITIRRAAGTITIRPAPPREPPFDDEVDAGQARPGRYDRPLPFDRAPRRPMTVAPPVGARGELPDPVQWARRLLVGVIETAGGRRPLNQLATLLSPSVAAGLRADFELAAQLGRPHWTQRARIQSVRGSCPADEVAEVSATVRAGERVRAVAMRLEVRHGRWCCVRLVLG